MKRSILLLALLTLTACPGSNGGPGGGGGAGGGAGGGGGGGTGLPEVCDNSLDDDGDSKVDCGDSDCIGAAHCCLDLCDVGSSICDPAGVKACKADPLTGCRSFAAATSCAGGLVCSGGTCVGSCSDECTEAQKQCSSTGGVVECKRLSSGCTDWVALPSCANGQVCSGGACVAASACQDQCTEGAGRCAGSGGQTCVRLLSGCTDWSFPTACPQGQSCSPTSNGCSAQAACSSGAIRCAASSPAVETCDANKKWVVTQTCPQSCAAGACTGSTSCSPAAVRCSGKSVEICNSTGTAWLFNQTCNVGCSGGLCTDPCGPGEKRCNSKTPEVCNAAGTGWTAQAVCSTDCHLGECIPADLIIDGVTKTLEGNLAFQNAVIIRNGGQLRVGPSGNVKIRAKSVSVDAASNINANAVGDTTGSTYTVSFYSHCHNGYECCKNGYDVTVTLTCYGTSLSPASQCSVAPSTNPCTQPANFALSVNDLSVSEGLKVGSDMGGGLVQLIAESVDVKGQITANGAGSNGGGGTVLIAADVITGSGAIQASGQTLGYAKLLRGSTNSFSGSLPSGSRAVKSVMPPLEIVSGSHPNESRWYNDGVGDLYVAWNKPFPTVNGYWFKVSTSASTLPTNSANGGTFLQGESHVVPAKELAHGPNYFHIVSMDSAFDVGTVKSAFRANINTEPPYPASSTHPYERTWYQPNTVFFNWDNPQDDASFTGFFYLLDQYADTVPGPSNGTFTTLKQVNLPNLANGIWIFHVVARDTRNALTKAAGHFVVYVGSELPSSNLSGSAFDGSNASAPLKGVTISINRGLFTTTTTTSGTYTFSGDLFVGTWEVTASKQGYLPQTKTITLTASDGGSSGVNENFVLVKEP